MSSLYGSSTIFAPTVISRSIWPSTVCARPTTICSSRTGRGHHALWLVQQDM
jgi:hypothetical protein